MIADLRSAATHRVIERALIQLDRPKLQVAFDVTIAEVTLNDQLDYGVQFFLDKGAVLNVSQSTLPVTPTLPGFTVVLGNALSPRVVINALHQYTDVKNFFLIPLSWSSTTNRLPWKLAIRCR